MTTESQNHDELRSTSTEWRFAARLIDLVCLAGALWVATALNSLDDWSANKQTAIALGGILFVLQGQAGGLYRYDRGERLTTEIGRVWLTWAVTFLLLVAVAFVAGSSADFSRRTMLTWAFLAPAAVTLWRVVAALITHELRARGYHARHVAIAGVSPLGMRLANRFESEPWMGLRLTGFYDDRGLSRCEHVEDFRWEMRGSFDDLVDAARRGEIDLVHIALPPRAEPRIAELIRKLSDTTASVHLAYDFSGFDMLRADWATVGGIPVMSLIEQPFHGTDGVLKRLEDVVLGSFILALIAVPMAAIALGIKLTSKGPVFFKQHRYGLNGEVVGVLKFRTMTVCEDGPEVKQATRNDKRITRFGAILRRTSLDELPQFLQVITGTMSIVGPRPHAVAHNEAYRSRIHGYMLRHKVKPGITGWAQVNGWRGETDTLEKMEKRVQFDLDYIRSWHLSFDLRIIFMTVRQVVFGHDSAY